MERGLEQGALLSVGGGRRIGDKFIIIRCFRDQAGFALELRQRWPDIEIFAPVERRMIRPRRKTSKRKPFWIERPLFFEYMAISFVDDWWVLGKKILLNGEGLCLVDRRRLNGMLIESRKRSWEGELVEIVSGPFKGLLGIYERGRVRLNIMGREVRARINVFDLYKKS